MRLGLAIFLIYGLALSAANAQVVANVQPRLGQKTAPIYTWKTDIGKNKAGVFQFCQLHNMLDNGMNIELAANVKRQQYLALKFLDAKLVPHDNYPLLWQIDNLAPQQVVAKAANAQTLNFALNDALLAQLSGGKTLSLIGPTDQLDIDLVGINGAVLALQDCVQVHGGLAVKPLLPPADSVDLSAGVAEKTALKKDSIKLPTLPPKILARFSQAQLTPQQVAVVPPSERHKLPLDFVWDVQDLFVGYKAVGGTMADFKPFMQAYLQGLKTLCAGSMRAETGQGAVQALRQQAYQAVDVACDHGGQITVTALLFEYAQKQQHVFFIEAPAHEGADAIKVRDKLVHSVD
jgi:hypothetical protein